MVEEVGGPREPLGGEGQEAMAVGIAATFREDAIALNVPRHTTVYVGRIPKTYDEERVDLLLGACGRVRSFLRATHPETNAAKHYGFCEYRDGLSCMRAIEVLDGLQVEGQLLVVKPNTATERYLNAVKESINVAHQDSGAGRGEAAEGAEDPAASALALESVLSCSAAREAVRDCLGQSSKDFAAAFLDELGRGGGGTERVGPDRKEDDGAEQRQREKEACEKRLREWETENERRLRDRSRARRKEEALTSARHGAIRRDEQMAPGDGAVSGWREPKRLAEERADKKSREDEERAEEARKAERITVTITGKKGSAVAAKGPRVDLGANELVGGGQDLEELRTWVLRETKNLLGEEEQSLCDFVMGKVEQKATAVDLVKELQPFLDDEAPVFVKKLFNRL